MIILDLVQNLALLVALAVICQFIEAWWRTRRLASQLLHGLLFGGVGVVSMMTPVDFMPGIFFDGRSIILSVGGLFGGPVVALISALLCGAYRLWLGGAGAPVGLGVIFESAALGAAFHYWRRRTARPLGLLELWSFGLLVHGVMLGLMLLLPGGARQAVWNEFGLAIIGIYPVATMLICRLFLDYEKQWRDRTALQESEDKFKCFFEHSNVGQSITRPSGEIQVNQAFCDLLGYSPVELRHQSWQAITHPEDREPTQRVMDSLLAGKQNSARLTKRFLHKNGSVVWADVSTALRRDPAGQPLYFMTAVIDITERQQVEAELRKTNRALQLVSLFNQELVRATNEKPLLEAVCRLAVEQGGYRLAWVGFAEQDEAKSVRPVAQSGFEDGYLDTVNLTWADTEHGRGPAGTAIRTGQPALGRNISTDPSLRLWREAALERGYASLIALPLRDRDRCFGALMVYAAEPDAFDAEEAKLLGELAGDLAYGIGALRHRAERELVEAELEQTAREWQTTFDATNDAIWILDNDQRVRRSNRTAERFFQRPCGEMIGECCWAIVHGTTEPHPSCPFVRARQSGHREMMELQQGERWFQDMVDPILDAAGQYAGAVHIVSDITERKRAEEALRKSEQEFRSLAEAMPQIVWTCQPDGRNVYFNQQWVDYTGLTLEESYGHGWNTPFHPDDRQRSWDAWQNATQNEATYSLECRLRRADGAYRWWLVRGVPLRDASGKILKWLGTCTDIEDIKQSEAALRESEERLRLAQRAARIGIWDHDFRTQHTVWTPEQEALFGYAPGTYAGTPMLFEEIVHADDRPRLAQAIARAIETGSFDLEFRATRLDGAVRWFAGHGQIYRDAAGRPARMIGINFDITEKKQLEANFLRIQRMEGIGALAGGIAHDLNNILAPILMVGPLLRETVSDSESRQMIDTVEGCARRGADIIKQLLTFARGQPGARAPLPVRHLLNEMHKLIRETFPRNIQPRVNVPKDLWLILGDATQIHQALMNLCVNARDALPEGGTLTLAAENMTLDETAAALAPEAKPGEYVRVSVADTGTGIAPDHLDRIFDPFFTTKEIGKGTGLGLATVLGIVRGHGGFVRVNSQVGQGTTFELNLPASPEAKAAATPAAEALPPRGQGELILAVDDEASVREIIRHTLEKFGYRAIVAGEGAEALALFGQHPEIKAVITDMMMPGMDGPKLVRALRQLNARLPIVGMTGLAERAGVRGLEALNLPAVLNKPFAVVSLLTALHEALAKSA